MNWLQDLLTNPDSIAHIVALYSFVIAVGVLLGKINLSSTYKCNFLGADNKQ